MELKDFEELLEKVVAGHAGPDDVSRLKNAVTVNPQLKKRWQAATEACMIVCEAGRFTPIENIAVPPFPPHRKAELLAAIQRIPIDNLEPVDLLKRYGRFAHAQLFGKILGYDPEIKTGRLTLKLSEWNYDDADRTEQEDLERWTKQKPGFESLLEQLFAAAEPAWNSPMWNDKYDYRKVLLEIREHLKLPGYPDESYAVIESQILLELIRRIRENVAKMRQKQRDTFYKSIEDQLLKEGKSLGGLSFEQLLWAGSGATLISAIGAEVAAGIILAHLGIGHAILLGLGLYSVPVGLIGGAIFAPIVAGFIAYQAGRHNYSKTIPIVVTLAALRQQQIESAKSSGNDGANLEGDR